MRGLGAARRRGGRRHVSQPELFFAVALSFRASAAFAQTQPQRAAMALGVAQSGVVRAIDVVDGAHVEAGQVLVELDCEPLRMEIDVRAASLAAADAVYERVVNGPRPEEIAIGEAGVGVALARAEEARATLDRAHGLEVRISITLAQLLVAEPRFPHRRRGARGRAQEACAAQVGSRFEDIAEAKARRDSAAAFLDEGKADLDQCSVRAPAAGTIKVLVTLGQLVSTYAPTTLVQLTPDAK
jgi:HlyD family secretion protein